MESEMEVWETLDYDQPEQTPGDDDFDEPLTDDDDDDEEEGETTGSSQEHAASTSSYTASSPRKASDPYPGWDKKKEILAHFRGTKTKKHRSWDQMLVK